jgi:(1->4)-alpha-D-glucan 1-alpha-D-glucosylmutase
MYIPASTYRVQLNSTFTFKKLKAILPYLKKLGISTIYAAPIFASKPKSIHGYDGVNPEMINREIGTLQEFIEICGLLKELKMGWLQDIVPNHMAFDSSNEWLMDIFEKGPHSDFASYFDIDWHHPDPSLKGKVLAPFLGEVLESLIQKGDLTFTYHQNGFMVECQEVRFPTSWSSYYNFLAGIQVPEELKETYQQLADDCLLIKDNFDNPEIVASMSHLKEVLFGLYSAHPTFKEAINQHLKKLNQDIGLSTSLLDQQFFKLTYYGASDTLINYRRFFVINQLICLRMEEKKVFDHFHFFVKTLLDMKLIDAIRVDHIDGLYDPAQYLTKLRELAGNEYLIVEKILASEEEMPHNWPAQGASGYEFLSLANQLFTKNENKEAFRSIYKSFIDISFDYNELVREKKSYMLKKRMDGQLDNLLAFLLESKIEVSKVWHKSRLKEALFQLLISFPVYRTYINSDLFSETDKSILKGAFRNALSRNDDLKEELLLLEKVMSEENMQNEKNLHFMLRFQQFTAPLAAKGVEDTAFYVYNCLISHNEVGDSPNSFGISTKAFHQRMLERKKWLPYSMNTLSTHDTKRGEDARARIHVLSEIPEEWATRVFQWKTINQKHKTKKEKEEMPVANDEYFIYQSLIGGFPMEGTVTEDFTKRLKDFMLKALREAKVYTDYPDFNLEYEEATSRFVENILKDPEFLDSFSPFFMSISDRAILLSLAQTLVKNTAPGIPDTYQGSEMWELSFVDPDNRREIDFETRTRILEQMSSATEISTLLKDLVKNKRDGRIKLFTTWRSLNERWENKILFEEGEYTPLQFEGEKADLMVGFGRFYQGQWFLTVVPREATLFDTNNLDVWKDTGLALPNGPTAWKNLLTEQEFTGNSPLRIRELFTLFPVALLKSKNT